MEIEGTLKQIGLTSSEVKVYLALLKIGLATKGPLVDKAKIAPSKIYNVLDKLADKGLVSMIIRNNVKNYSAAPLERIKDYLKEKKNELENEEKVINSLLPVLARFQSRTEETTAEVFKGWRGMETAYSTVLNTMKAGETAYILGASTGMNIERTKSFFFKYSKIAKDKKINVKVIFNENARQYVKEMEDEAKITFNKRFLSKETKTEIAVSKNAIGIVILKEEPIVVLIRDKETANSFITYFEELWKIAKR